MDSCTLPDFTAVQVFQTCCTQKSIPSSKDCVLYVKLVTEFLLRRKGWRRSNVFKENAFVAYIDDPICYTVSSLYIYSQCTAFF